tara:strand:+ start:218 stop:487 length:270 start_codon:yes stop_codon:yes gene_type:complete
MKKISSFIPQHVINKKELIKELNAFISHILPMEIISYIEIVNIKDNVLIISCKNSSIATLIRFEKQKYINMLSNNKIQKINDIKIVIES